MSGRAGDADRAAPPRQNVDACMCSGEMTTEGIKVVTEHCPVHAPHDAMTQSMYQGEGCENPRAERCTYPDCECTAGSPIDRSGSALEITPGSVSAGPAQAREAQTIRDALNRLRIIDSALGGNEALAALDALLARANEQTRLGEEWCAEVHAQFEARERAEAERDELRAALQQIAEKEWRGAIDLVACQHIARAALAGGGKPGSA